MSEEQDMDERLRDAVNKLVIASSRVMKQFKSGHHPTFEQLGKLEGALFPFLNDKLCGHALIEECNCEEQAK